MKNALILLLVKISRIFIPKHKKQNRILIVSTTALGDTLWATPAIESIRKNAPNSFLAVLTSPIGQEVFKNNPYIDELFLLKEPLLWHVFSLWKTLYQKQFDTILIFHASQRLTLPLSALLGASTIIGTAGINKGLDRLFTKPLPNDRQHEIVRRLKIIEEIGIKPVTEKLSFFLDSSSAPRLKKPLIAFHPGSKDPFKRWPKEKFIELGRRLKQEMPCEIILTGVEQELKQEIASQIPGAHIDETGKLKDLAHFLNKIDLLVSNDTGPVHLACALNKPVIALYASTDPTLCGPHQAEKAIAISRPPTCTPCLKRKCKLPFCFLQIGVDEVFSQIETLIRLN